MKMKYNFSEIIYHVLGYWKWFAEINDSTPLLKEQVAVAKNASFFTNKNTLNINSISVKQVVWLQELIVIAWLDIQGI